jgi:hypothetical protein
MGDDMPMAQVTGGNRNPLTKRIFHVRLREWLKLGEDRIDGGTASDDRRPWIYIRDGGSLYNIHADSTREGVGQYLSLVDRYGDSLDWSVVMSKRGKPTKAGFGPLEEIIEGFYVYFVRRV